ncbi:hypothetical protein LCGC14_2224080 [marine sediment metagenome]|uniref:Uncharacterized protein n=1 Tax=marine sediment metagenome TaxID=412755 RepID=A0A0F9DXL4_9ZZZZ
MNELGEEYIVPLRAALTALFDRIAGLFKSHGNDPDPSSLASTELRDAARPESIVTACSISTQLIEYSSEHLTAFVKTITEPIEPLACWTCVRSMLESCAISAWLSDPAIASTARIGRMFAMRYEGMQQQLKFGRVVNRSTSELQSLSDRIDDVERTAMSLGYQPVCNRNGQRIGIGQRMPNATELIGLMLDEEAMYRLLSAVAHGHSWAIIRLGFQGATGANQQSTMAGINVKTFEKKVYMNGLAYLGLGAAKAFARALWNQSLYMGWNQDALEEVLEDVFDTLDVTPNSRFWRSSTCIT